MTIGSRYAEGAHDVRRPLDSCRAACFVESCMKYRCRQIEEALRDSVKSLWELLCSGFVRNKQRTQDESRPSQTLSRRVSFCRLLETGMSKTSFRKNSDAIPAGFIGSVEMGCIVGF